MAEPLLLLKPGGSRDRNGPVTPSIPSTSTIPGQFGPAWELAVGPISLPHDPQLNHPGVTVVMRSRSSGTAGRPFAQLPNLYGDHRVSISYQLGNRAVFSTGTQGSFHPFPSGMTVGQWHYLGLTADRTEMRGYGVGDDGPVRSSPAFISDPSAEIVIGGPVGSSVVSIESVVFFDTVLSSSEVYRIGNIPETWTWENLQGPTETFEDQSMSGTLSGTSTGTRIGAITQPRAFTITGTRNQGLLGTMGLSDPNTLSLSELIDIDTELVAIPVEASDGGVFSILVDQGIAGLLGTESSLVVSTSEDSVIQSAMWEGDMGVLMGGGNAIAPLILRVDGEDHVAFYLMEDNELRGTYTLSDEGSVTLTEGTNLYIAERQPRFHVKVIA